jgi:hypothetical protein
MNLNFFATLPYKEALLDYAKALGRAREHSLPLPPVETAPDLHLEVAQLLRIEVHPKDMPSESFSCIFQINRVS